MIKAIRRELSKRVIYGKSNTVAFPIAILYQKINKKNYHSQLVLCFLCWQVAYQFGDEEC